MSNELYHYGIPGMKWGIRRYQNADGSLTRAGMDRYGIRGYARDQATAFRNFRERNRKIQGEYDRYEAQTEKGYKRGQKLSDADVKKLSAISDRASKGWNDSRKQYANDRKAANARLKSDIANRAKSGADKARSSMARVREKMNTPEFKANAKKVAIVGGAVIATAAAAYGGYKLSQLLKGRAYDKAYSAAKAWLNKGVDKAVLSQPASRVHGYRNEVERVAKKLANDASKNFKSVITANMGKYDPMKNGIVKEWNPNNINIWAEAVKYLDYETAPSYLRDFL